MYLQQPKVATATHLENGAVGWGTVFIQPNEQEEQKAKHQIVKGSNRMNQSFRSSSQSTKKQQQRIEITGTVCTDLCTFILIQYHNRHYDIWEMQNGYQPAVCTVLSTTLRWERKEGIKWMNQSECSQSEWVYKYYYTIKKNDFLLWPDRPSKEQHEG